MAREPFLTLILPAYNEAGSIERTLDAMQTYLERHGHTYEIIVSADGNDGTREIVAERARRDSRLSIMGSPERLGKGRGIRLAVEKSRGQIVGFLDADYKVAIDDIEKILPWFERGYDLVIGSRGLAESRIERRPPWYRRIGSIGFGIVIRILIGLWNVRDTQCGFKFFRGEVARDLFGRQRIDGYMFDVEVLRLAMSTGYRLKEVGVNWRDDGDTRLQLVRGNWRNLLDIFRIRFGSYPKKQAIPTNVAEVQERQAA